MMLILLFFFFCDVCASAHDQNKTGQVVWNKIAYDSRVDAKNEQDCVVRWDESNEQWLAALISSDNKDALANAKYAIEHYNLTKTSDITNEISDSRLFDHADIRVGVHYLCYKVTHGQFVRDIKDASGGKDIELSVVRGFLRDDTALIYADSESVSRIAQILYLFWPGDKEIMVGAISRTVRHKITEKPASFALAIDLLSVLRPKKQTIQKASDKKSGGKCFLQ